MSIQAGYDHISLVSTSGTTICSRAERMHDHRSVILRHFAGNFPTIEDRAALRREFEILKGLDVPGVLKPIGLEEGEDHFHLVLEDFSGNSLNEAAAVERRNLDTFLSVALNLSKTVGHLHQRQIIHKNLQPANILFNPDSGDIRMVDFRKAMRMTGETQSLTPEVMRDENLAYISPEQTGRMNRQVDYRSDFYSLGMTLYGMLVGHPPFETNDPMELIHCHIARLPPSPSDLNQDIPTALSEIVLKLVAKNAEERYQGAFGLSADLEICRALWRRKGKIGMVDMGARDISNRFQIPQRLYGRDGELEQLEKAYEDSLREGSRVFLITGETGTGKTSLALEIQKTAVRNRGFFVTGKCDPSKQGQAYAPVAQAIGDLMRQLMVDPEESIAGWKARLERALGGLGRVLVDVIPEVAMLLGECRPVPELAGRPAQDRFVEILLRFIGVLARGNRPLVLFLDDLQWADNGSRSLFQTLAGDAGIEHLMLIGVWRRDEGLRDSPPIAEVERDDRTSWLVLGDLDGTALTRLIADTLSRPLDEVRGLSDTVFEKTNGNPFFVKQFLWRLYREKVICFDFKQGRWSWQIAAVRGFECTGNVLDLMVMRIRELAVPIQETLKWATCLGRSFTIGELAEVRGIGLNVLAGHLHESVKENLVFPSEDTYKYVSLQEGESASRLLANITFTFVHERIAQAADSLIAEPQRRLIHEAIGRALLARQSPGGPVKGLHQVVDHLNRGLPADPSDRERLIRLNLQAGTAALESSDFEASARYFDMGLALLHELPGTADPSVTFPLLRGKTACALARDLLDQAEACHRKLQEQAQSLEERLEVIRLGVGIFEAMGRTEEALEIGLRGLALLGYRLSPTPSPLSVASEILLLRWSLDGRTVDELAELPVMTDQRAQRRLGLLMQLAWSAYRARPALWMVIVARATRLSLRRGNAAWSAYAYIQSGVLLGQVRGQWGRAVSLGKLAVKLSRGVYNPTLKAQVLYFYGLLNHHGSLLSRNMDFYRESLRHCLESGQPRLAGDCLFGMLTTAWAGGRPLTEIAGLARQSRGMRCGGRITAERASLFLEWVEILLAPNTEGNCFSDDRAALNPYFMASENLQTFLLLRLQVSFFTGRFEDAARHAQQLDEKVFLFNTAGFLCGEYYFYAAMTLAMLLPGTPYEVRRQQWRQLHRFCRRLKELARSGSGNYQPRHLLVAAEIARLKNRDQAAAGCYERAIRAATRAGFLHIEAIAKQRIAEFHFSRDLPTTAGFFMKDARQAYRKWGADALVARLEENWSRLLLTQGPWEREGHGEEPKYSGNNPSFHIDLEALVKTAQTICSEIDLSRLLKKIMQFLIENAGAQRGFLILEKLGKWVIEAEGNLGNLQISVRQGIPLENSEDLCRAVVMYAVRTGESVLLDHACLQGRFLADPYIMQGRKKSILALPISHQGKFTSVVYLENDLIPGAFTPVRLEVIRVLSAQLAIAIENARLYENLDEQRRTLEQRVAERTMELSAANLELVRKNEDLVQTQNQLIMQEKVVALGAMASGIAHEIKNPVNFINNFAMISAELTSDLRQTLARYRQQMAGRDWTNLEELLADLKQNAEFINLHGERINEIVNQILSFAIKSTNRKTLCDLNEVIFKYSDVAYRSRIVEKACAEIALRHELDPAVGLVEVVPEDLGRVIVHLLNNAFDAALEAAGQMNGEPLVMLTSVRRAGRVEIRIRDNGPGIPEEVQGKVFTPFFTTKAPGNGIGLGLAISRDIVTGVHGGTIDFETQPGRYTVFIISLPA